MIHALRIQSLSLLAAAALCPACASTGSGNSHPEQTGRAHLAIVYPGGWSLGGPAGKGVAMSILKLDDSEVCPSGDDCPIELDVPAGTRTLLFRCMVLQDNLRTPALTPWVRVSYQGTFIAGHRYEVQPAASVPDCKVQVQDMGPGR